jgi:hypothetical protein
MRSIRARNHEPTAHPARGPGARSLTAIGAIGALLASTLTASPPAAAAGARCAGHRPDCFATLAGALAAARDGDTIRLLPGTFLGGVAIDKSVHLVGAGARRTVIRGGGPVLTITTDASRGRHVTISGVTITGGVAHGDGVVALGGGIYIPTGPNGSIGADVALDHVVVSGNRAIPTTTSASPSGVKCPQGDCPFALARGGGIASWGNLSLSHVSVRGNFAGGRASDAVGGGIASDVGSLSIDHSAVVGNRVKPESIGRFAEGGGLFVNSGVLTLRRSRLDGNRADLVTTWPTSGQGELINMNANSGAVHIGDGVQALVTDSQMTHNAISAIDAAGEPLAFDSAMLVGDSHLDMRRTTVAHNSVLSRTATSDDVGPSGTAVELDGPGVISDSRITDNSVSAYSQYGNASASSGLAVYDFFNNPRQVTVTGTLIQNNTALAQSEHGSATSLGGGVFTTSLLALKHVTVRRNVATALGVHATAQGAGIWNGVFFGGPPVTLHLEETQVVRNVLAVSPGGTRQGAGLFTNQPAVRQRTVIADNQPDQCYGCTIQRISVERSVAPGSRRPTPRSR